MVNPKRGQIKIKINEQEFDCRVTLDAILKMETLLGVGLMQILQKLSQGTLKTSEIISILLPVIRSSGKDIDEKKVGELIFNDYGGALRETGQILTLALGGESEEGKTKEVENV